MEISNKKILIIGDVFVDRYVCGEITRLSPEGPFPVLKCSARYEQLGGAANVANNLRKSGTSVFLIGVIGEDESGKILTHLLNEENINYFLPYSKRQTSTKTRYFHKDQQLYRVDYETTLPIGQQEENKILEYLELFSPDYILISDYNKGLLTPKIFAELFNYQKPVIANIKPENVAYLINKPNTTIILNDKEYKDLLSHYPVSTMEALYELLKIDTFIVTRGVNGVDYIYNGNFNHLDAHQVELVSSIGAGDTFSAYFTMGISTGRNVHDSIILANKAAGIAVSKHGTSIVSLEEI